MDPFYFDPLIRNYFYVKCNIKKDYKIVDRYVNDYDHYGPKYWIETHNGLECWEWELETHIRKHITKLRDYIKKNGFVFKGTTYYFNHNLLDDFYK